MTAIWIDNPAIILKKEHILDFWPKNEMSYEEKMNSITRFILYSCFLWFLIFKSYKILILFLGFILVIVYVHKSREHNIKQEGYKNNDVKDLFINSFTQNNNSDTNNSADNTNSNATNDNLQSKFSKISHKNPMNNVLLSDIHDHPNKKAAPPSFYPPVKKQINESIKKTIQEINPTIKNTNDQLFGDLYGQEQLEKSNHAFYSMANTKIVNDQESFGQYLYGNMPSSKETNNDAAFIRNLNNQNYNLY